MFADLIDGPLAHLPSGRFGANRLDLCAAIAHNLLRAAGVLAGQQRADTRIHPAAPDHQRRGPTGPPTTPTDAAPTHPLALG